MFVVSLLLPMLLPFAALALEIRQVNSDGAILLESSPTNFAMSSSALIENGWKTFTRNEDKIVIVSSDCQITMKNSQALNGVEQNLFNSAKSKLGARQPWGQNPKKYFSTRYISGRIGSQIAIDMNNRNLESKSGAAISKNDDNNFSIAKPDFPMNVVQVFLNNDVVTFVYSNGRIQMKPTNCLEPAEQQLIQQSRLEVEKAEEEERERMQNDMMGQGQFAQSYSSY